MKRPPFPYVRFTWLDAYSEDAWKLVSELPLTDHVCEASGYLFKETPTMVMVTASIAWNDEALDWEASNSLAVPKGMILGSIKTLKRAPKKKPPEGGQ